MVWFFFKVDFYLQLYLFVLKNFYCTCVNCTFFKNMYKHILIDKLLKFKSFFQFYDYWMKIHRENICQAEPGGGSTIHLIHIDPLPSTPDPVSSTRNGSTGTLIYSRALSLNIWAPWSILELFISLSSTRIYSRVSHWIAEHNDPTWSQPTLP